MGRFDVSMIDLRSDTVTLPTPAMREGMARAELGDDVYGEDPTVNRLERMAAEIVGMEAAMLVPTGTMGNLAAMLAHCPRGTKAFLGAQAHTYVYEAGGAAALDQSRSLEPVQQRHDARLVHPKMRAQLDLRDAGIGAHQAQQAEQSRTNVVLADEADVGAPRRLVGAPQVVAQQLRQRPEVDLGAGRALAPGAGRPLVAHACAVATRLFDQDTPET